MAGQPSLPVHRDNRGVFNNSSSSVTSFVPRECHPRVFLRDVGRKLRFTLTYSSDLINPLSPTRFPIGQIIYFHDAIAVVLFRSVRVCRKVRNSCIVGSRAAPPHPLYLDRDEARYNARRRRRRRKGSSSSWWGFRFERADANRSARYFAVSTVHVHWKESLGSSSSRFLPPPLCVRWKYK